MFDNWEWRVTDHGIEAVRGRSPIPSEGITPTDQISADRLSKTTERGNEELTTGQSTWQKKPGWTSQPLMMRLKRRWRFTPTDIAVRYDDAEKVSAAAQRGREAIVCLKAQRTEAPR